MKIRNLQIDFEFLWYDLWIGIYYDTKSNVLYFCPLPMCVFKFRKIVKIMYFDKNGATSGSRLEIPWANKSSRATDD